MKRYIVPLSLSRQALLCYYRGSARLVLAQSNEGVHVQFPVELLRGHVSRSGVQGTFVFHVDSQHRLVKLERLHRPAR